MGGAHRNRHIGIPRIVDCHAEAGLDTALVHALRETVTGITRSDDHDDPRFHQPFNLDAQRALAAGKPLGLEIVPDTQVDAVNQNPPAVAVQFLDLLQGCDDAARPARPVTFAVLVKHLEAHELAAGGHPGDRLDRYRYIDGSPVLIELP